MEPESPLADSRDLAAFGYKQELHRSLGSFSAFAAGFSYLSILTGVFQLFHEGFGHGGPAFFWSWPIVFLGQFLVALCFAELAAHYPLSGGVYQWSKHVGSRAVGWMTGWVYLASLVISISAVALALQVTLPQIAPVFQVVSDPALNAVLLGCILIGFTTVVNAVGVGLLAKINNVGVFTELIGAILLIVLLAANARRGPEIVIETQGHGTSWSYLGPFLAAALMAHYVMYGFDTAGALAEETNAPCRRAPRAILQALAACAAAGALLLLFALMAAPDLGKLAEPTGGLPSVVKDVLGDTVGTFFLLDIVFAVVVCTLAVHTSTVRLMFAMARDNNLPFGKSLSRVSRASRTPVVPALVAGALAAVILVVNVVVPGFIDRVAPLAVLWANLAYLLVIVPLLIRRCRGLPLSDQPTEGAFSLGRWGLPINLVAAVWSVLVLLNIGWPRFPTPETPWIQPYSPVLISVGLLIVGMTYYWLVQKHRSGVRAEHRITLAEKKSSGYDEKLGNAIAGARLEEG